MNKQELIDKIKVIIPHKIDWTFLTDVGVGKSTGENIDDWKWSIKDLTIRRDEELMELYNIIKRAWASPVPYTT